MTAQINVKIEQELKDNVENILDSLGITLTEAIRMFLKKVDNEQGIPFDLKVNSYKQDVVNDLIAAKNERKILKRFNSVESAFNHLDNKE